MNALISNHYECCCSVYILPKLHPVNWFPHLSALAGPPSCVNPTSCLRKSRRAVSRYPFFLETKLQPSNARNFLPSASSFIYALSHELSVKLIWKISKWNYPNMDSSIEWTQDEMRWHHLPLAPARSSAQLDNDASTPLNARASGHGRTDGRPSEKKVVRCVTLASRGAQKHLAWKQAESTRFPMLGLILSPV